MSEELKMLGAVIALITTPACAYMAYWIKTLYADLKDANAKTDSVRAEQSTKIESILKENLSVLQSISTRGESDGDNV